MSGNRGLQKFSDVLMVTELGIEGVHIEIHVYLLYYCATMSGAKFSEKVVLDIYGGKIKL